MSSTPANIPGFYFDPEKKKYFRLQPHHRAVEQKAGHSSSTVLQQERNRKRAEQEAAELAKTQAKRRRAPLRSNSYYAATLFRELGVNGRDAVAEERRKIFARGLRRNRVWETEPGARIAAFAHREVDGGGREVVVCTASGRGGDIRRIPLRDSPAWKPSSASESDVTVEADMSRARTITHSWSRATSLTITPGSLLAATLLGTASSSLYLRRLPTTAHSTPYESTTSFKQTSLWTISSSPHPSGSLLIGSSHSTILVRDHAQDVSFSHFPIPSDVFATTFSHASEHLFLAGSRDSAVRLFDVRTPPSTQDCKHIVIRHSSSVTGLRYVSDVEVVVNGLKGPRGYDLRYPHPKTPSSGFARETAGSVEFRGCGRDDGYILDLGFDVSVREGLMVVAGQEGGVGIWSLKTGERVREKVGEGGVVKWVRFEEGRRGTRLWMAEGGGLDCWEY